MGCCASEACSNGYCTTATTGPVRVGQPARDLGVLGALGSHALAAAHASSGAPSALGVDEEISWFPSSASRADPRIGSLAAASAVAAVSLRPDRSSVAWGRLRAADRVSELRLSTALPRSARASLCPSGTAPTVARDLPTPAAPRRTAPALLESFDWPPRALSRSCGSRRGRAWARDLHSGEHERGWRRLRAIPGIGIGRRDARASTAISGTPLPAGDVGLLKLVVRCSAAANPYCAPAQHEGREFFAPSRVGRDLRRPPDRALETLVLTSAGDVRSNPLYRETRGRRGCVRRAGSVEPCSARLSAARRAARISDILPPRRCRARAARRDTARGRSADMPALVERDPLWEQASAHIPVRPLARDRVHAARDAHLAATLACVSRLRARGRERKARPAPRLPRSVRGGVVGESSCARAPLRLWTSRGGRPGAAPPACSHELGEPYHAPGGVAARVAGVESLRLRSPRSAPTLTHGRPVHYLLFAITVRFAPSRRRVTRLRRLNPMTPRRSSRHGCEVFV